MPGSDSSLSIDIEIVEALASLRGTDWEDSHSDQWHDAFRKVVDLSVSLSLASERQAPVVIVPGGMASSLFDCGGVYFPERIWINPVTLGMGWFSHLQLADFTDVDGESDLMPDVKIEAKRSPIQDPLHMLYAKLARALEGRGFTPHLFPYDWRKDMAHRDVARRLVAGIKTLASEYRTPVHIITHSQGAMVARWALSELAKENAGDKVGQVILLGPANYGAFVAALAVGDAFQEIPLFNGVGSLPLPPTRAQGVLASFTSLYQLMPWDAAVAPSLMTNDIRSAKFWDGCKMSIQKKRLKRSFPTSSDGWAKRIDTTSFNGRITVILGTGRQTPMGVMLDGRDVVVDHGLDADGDGWVPNSLACLPDSTAYEASGVGHIELPRDRDVIRGVLDILHGKKPASLRLYNSP